VRLPLFVCTSVTERALAAAASILWDGPTGRTAAATVRTLARARSSKVDRVARRGPSVLTTIARAIADCRPPVDRSLDDRLDAAATVPCYSLLRTGATGSSHQLMRRCQLPASLPAGRKQECRGHSSPALLLSFGKSGRELGGFDCAFLRPLLPSLRLVFDSGARHGEDKVLP